MEEEEEEEEEARWLLPGRRVVPRTVGLFCAFQEMRCWQKWWMDFRAGFVMEGLWVGGITSVIGWYN